MAVKNTILVQFGDTVLTDGKGPIVSSTLLALSMQMSTPATAKTTTKQKTKEEANNIFLVLWK